MNCAAAESWGLHAVLYPSHVVQIFVRMIRNKALFCSWMPSFPAGPLQTCETRWENATSMLNSNYKSDHSNFCSGSDV